MSYLRTMLLFAFLYLPVGSFVRYPSSSEYFFIQCTSECSHDVSLVVYVSLSVSVLV